MQVLIVDDDDFALSTLENTLGRMGYSVLCARTGLEALEILRRGDIRLVVTDWDMPVMNGIELCRALRREDLNGYVYIIMLTGREGAKQRLEGLCAGADDFLNKPLDPEELLVCLKTAERILALETRDVALFALAKLAESRDAEAGSHIERVQSYARLLARNLSPEVRACYGVDDEYIRLLYQTSPLHDLGKVGIPDVVLLKPGIHTPAETAIMRTHTLVGAQTLDAALSRFPNARFLQMARQIAASHHEKFDGSGYPQGLVGDQIPLPARIVAVADVYDALTSNRVYKAAMTHQDAKAIIIRDKGSHFDPEVVASFLRAEPQVLAIYDRLKDDALPKKVEFPLPPLPARDQLAPASCEILLAEDDPLLLQRLTEILSATGETILPAATGAEALKILNARNPRLILSDWVMPGLDGVELCRDVRARPGNVPVHFIMLTAHSDKERLLEAYAAGVDDFVSKPFDQEELLARVRAGIRSAKLHDEISRQASGSQALNAQLATVNSRLERLAITDELTGLFNRRHAVIRLEEQWSHTDLRPQPLTIAMIDIDHFKEINDSYGHDAGDAVLRRVAATLRDHTRGTDTVCRYGGDEFLIIFPNQTPEEAHVCTERIQAAVAHASFSAGHVKVSATLSIGIAARNAQMPQFTDLLKAADEALYVAKRNGRPDRRAGGMIPLDSTFGDSPEMPNSDSPPIAPMQPPPASAPAVPLADPIDIQAILKRCGGDPQFAAAITERFHKQAAPEADKIQNAFAANDAKTLGRVAHSLKSMAAYMSADAVTTLAKKLEDLANADQLSQIEPLLAQLKSEIDRTITWIAQKGGPAALVK